MSWASATATVVLPIPPGPLSVTKRSRSMRADKSLRMSSLPTIRSSRCGNQIGAGFSGAVFADGRRRAGVGAGTLRWTGATKQYPRLGTLVM